MRNWRRLPRTSTGIRVTRSIQPRVAAWIEADRANPPFPGWSRSLSRLASYFGTEFAFYFAWLAFYSRWLVLPAIGGLAV